MRLEKEAIKLKHIYKTFQVCDTVAYVLLYQGFLSNDYNFRGEIALKLHE